MAWVRSDAARHVATPPNAADTPETPLSRTPPVRSAWPRVVGCAHVPSFTALRLTMNAAPNVRIGGMLVGYYVLCERKAWLSMRGLWMEQESQAVALGRQIDRSSYARKTKQIMLTAEAPGGAPLVGKVDWASLDEGTLHETKKSRSAEDAHRWQLRFYLWLLKLNGVTRAGGTPFRGQLNYPKLRRTDDVALRPEHEDRLAEIVAALRRIAAQETPPPRIDRRSFCKKCAFEELCYA